MRKSHSINRAGRFSVYLLAAAFAFSGCATRHPWTQDVESVPTAWTFLQPGDELEIRFLGAPDLDVTQTVRRDGKIAMRIIGDVTAAGKSVGMLREELERLYGTQLQIKEITIYVRSPGTVFVAGAVLEPGPVEVSHPITALEAIVKAGGFNAEEAKTGNVIVIRQCNGKRQGYSIDMKKALAGHETDAFFLRPYDVVYVPRTGIAKVNQWVRQYINNMIPRTGLGYSSDGDVTIYR